MKYIKCIVVFIVFWCYSFYVVAQGSRVNDAKGAVRMGVGYDVLTLGPAFQLDYRLSKKWILSGLAGSKRMGPLYEDFWVNDGITKRTSGTQVMLGVRRAIAKHHDRTDVGFYVGYYHVRNRNMYAFQVDVSHNIRLSNAFYLGLKGGLNLRVAHDAIGVVTKGERTHVVRNPATLNAVFLPMLIYEF